MCVPFHSFYMNFNLGSSCKVSAHCLSMSHAICTFKQRPLDYRALQSRNFLLFNVEISITPLQLIVLTIVIDNIGSGSSISDLLSVSAYWERTYIWLSLTSFYHISVSSIWLSFPCNSQRRLATHWIVWLGRFYIRSFPRCTQISLKEIFLNSL